MRMDALCKPVGLSHSQNDIKEVQVHFSGWWSIGPRWYSKYLATSMTQALIIQPRSTRWGVEVSLGGWGPSAQAEAAPTRLLDWVLFLLEYPS